MQGSAIVKNGIITNRDLVISTKDVDATGEGKIDLPKNTIHYVIRLQLKGKPITVYVNINGPLNHAKVSVVKPSLLPTLLSTIF